MFDFTLESWRVQHSNIFDEFSTSSMVDSSGYEAEVAKAVLAEHKFTQYLPSPEYFSATPYVTPFRHTTPVIQQSADEKPQKLEKVYHNKSKDITKMDNDCL